MKPTNRDIGGTRSVVSVILLAALEVQTLPDKTLRQTLDPATLLAGTKSASASSAPELWR